MRALVCVPVCNTIRVSDSVVAAAGALIRGTLLVRVLVAIAYSCLSLAYY